MDEPVPVLPTPHASSSTSIPPQRGRRGFFLSSGLILAGIALLAVLVLMFWWSSEPAAFKVQTRAEARAKAHNHKVVPGYVTVATVLELGEVLLEKPGGYLANDLLPPGLLMDNIPEWEFGVLQQLRDFALALRNDFSRSQSQSADDKHLSEAQPLLAYSSDSWIFPATESQYREALGHFEAYLAQLGDPAQVDAQFYVRSDNLVEWLKLVEKQLGSLSQRLSASVGQARINTDLANESTATQSTAAPAIVMTHTPWMKIDNVFYEARGASYALLHLLKAIERDFRPVLEDKNAVVSVKQIIRELEEAQATVYSPMILNGGGYGLFANHSLVMANYLSRANAAISDLRKLLERG